MRLANFIWILSVFCNYDTTPLYQQNSTFIYASGPQPFPNHGPLDKFCLGSRTTKKNFANFPNFLAYFRVKDRKSIQISICNLVVTQSMKRHQISSQFRQKPA